MLSPLPTGPVPTDARLRYAVPRSLMHPGPTMVDLFAGAGGLAEGMLQAGVQVSAAVELHHEAALTHAFNHPDTTVFSGDIRSLDPARVLNEVQRRAGRREVNIVAGGPPCQGFSTAGRKRVDDPRNSLVREFIRFVEALEPQVFLLENVPGFQNMYGGAVHGEAQAEFSRLGYRTSERVVNAWEYGVPQTRKRFIMVGWRGSDVAPFEWPEAEFGDHSADLLFASGKPLVTAGEALDDIAYLAPGWEATRHGNLARSDFAQSLNATDSDRLFNHLATMHRAKATALISRIPAGGSIRDVPAEERGTRKLTMSRLASDKISKTVVSLPDDIIHYKQDRILTVRECARLQTFDDSFVFLGKRTSGFMERRVDVPQYTQVGNAVPPRLAYALGRQVINQFQVTSTDRRNLAQRVARHEMLEGSSGFAGYRLNPAAKGTIGAVMVDESEFPLPLAHNSDPTVDQAALRRWQRP